MRLWWARVIAVCLLATAIMATNVTEAGGEPPDGACISAQPGGSAIRQ